MSNWCCVAVSGSSKEKLKTASSGFRVICVAFQAGYTFVAFPESPSLCDCKSGYERAALWAAISEIPYFCEKLMERQ